jgi:hypothetical protein
MVRGIWPAKEDDDMTRAILITLALSLAGCDLYVDQPPTGADAGELEPDARPNETVPVTPTPPDAAPCSDAPDYCVPDPDAPCRELESGEWDWSCCRDWCDPENPCHTPWGDYDELCCPGAGEG